MADYTINIYQTGTTSELGSGVLDGNWFISAQDSDGNEIGTPTAGIFVISDGQVTLMQSDGTTPIRTIDVLAEASINDTIGLSTVNVRKSDGTLISVQNVEAEQSINYNVADSTVTINGIEVGNILATNTKNFKVVGIDGVTEVGFLNGDGNWQISGEAVVSGILYRDAAPVEGGTIRVYEEDGTTLIETLTTAADGSYTSSTLSSGLYILKCQFFGTGLAGSRASEPTIIPVTIEGTDVTGIDFFFITTASADPFTVSGNVSVEGVNQWGVEVELISINAVGAEAFVARDFTDVDGNYSFAAAIVSSLYVVRVIEDDSLLVTSGQELDLTIPPNGFSSGAQVVNFSFDIDRSAPLTGTIALRYGGDGNQASPQVGDLVHLERLLVNDAIQVGMDFSTITYEWYDSLTDTLIATQKGLPIDTTMVGKAPQLRVNGNNNEGTAMAEVIVDLGTVTNPGALTDHLYNKIALGQMIFDFSKMPTCADTIVHEDSSGLYQNYYRIWDATQTYELTVNNSGQTVNFNNTDKQLEGLGIDSMLQLIKPIGTAGHPAYNVVIAYNGSNVQLSGFTGKAGEVQTIDDGIIQTNNVATEPLAENSWSRGLIQLGMTQHTPADSLPVDEWNIVQVYYLPDVGQVAGVNGQTGKFRLNVKSADGTATTPAVYEETFSAWNNDTRMNLVDSFGTSETLVDGKFAFKMGTSKVKFLMMSIPDASVHQITQAEANALISDYDINNLEY